MSPRWWGIATLALLLAIASDRRCEAVSLMALGAGLALVSYGLIEQEIDDE